MRWLAIALLAACTGDRGAVPAPQPIGSAALGAPDRHDAGAGDAAPRVLTGVLTAAESVEIAPRAAGVITKVDVAAGDAVTAGQVVAEMDPVQLQEELRGAQAALGAATAARRQASVDIEDAKRKLARETEEFAAGTRAKMNVEDAAFALKRAEAAAEKAASAQAAEASRLETAKDHLGDAELRAPFDGTVAMRYRDAGNRVEAGAPIVRIVGHGGMRLRFAVPAERANDIAVGGRVTATVDTIAAPISATIKQVSPTIDAASGMIIVDAQLADGVVGLRSGLGARVTL